MANHNATFQDDTVKRAQGQIFAEYHRAYLEAGDVAREVVDEMLIIVSDPTTDPSDRDAALDTISEALFLFSFKHETGMGLDDIRDHALDEVQKELESLDAEQSTFAQRLRDELEKQEIIQQNLADLIGVNQSAISMMLNRQCHPQRGTVKTIAKALGLKPNQLWPDF